MPCSREASGHVTYRIARGEPLSLRRVAGVRWRPMDQRRANPTAAAVRTRPWCQRADTSPCPLLTGEGSPRCPRPVRRRHCIARRGCGEARLPSPLGGEGGSAKPRRMRVDRVSGVARASVQRRRPHPPLPGHLLPPRGEGKRRRGLHESNPRPPRIPHTPLAHHPNGAANRRCASGWVTGRRLRVESRSTPGRLRGTALGVLRPLCEELAGTVASHHAFVPCRTARQPDEGNWRSRARGGGWLSTR